MTKNELKDLLERFASEVRIYCRPSMVNYDVFPVFKEVDNYLKGKSIKKT